MNIFSFLRRRKPIPEPWAKYYTKEELNIKIPDISMYDQVKKVHIFILNILLMNIWVKNAYTKIY